ncbi:PVC-type heme-binding CxxCH protein [Aeoliella sp.]|uniref:PVC-type heme-binding CxxCH protein n=1 Tax=Aeoliella sp. TaxID=2795800 RepID=UPI003CCC439B
MRHVLYLLLAAIWSHTLGIYAHAAEPRVLVDGFTLERIASEPDIVTPVAVAFDRSGAMLVVESHTHKRPDEYDGPTSDRIRRFADTNGDGKFDTWSTYADGLRHAMNLVVRSDGAVVVVTRGDVFLLRDTDDDNVADERTTLVHLETNIDYPHNALGGFTFDREGGFYLGLGENFGGAYKLIGSDGSAFADSGGTGMVFHFDGDGSHLTRVAQGFWNPFGLCMVGWHTLFAVDNDPDASPPCRLIHVVPTGDYGHRWEYGRAGVHPLQAWDGELPGTLPMICGTGEAPCAVVPHNGYLWVTSWGDHRIERYKLAADGMSFSATCDIVVQGDEDFRPTGCAVGPDGALYFADWVSRSYPVHGKGRIWRLEDSTPIELDAEQWPAVQEVVRNRNLSDPINKADQTDPFARQIIVETLNEGDARKIGPLPRFRLATLQYLRWQGVDDEPELLRDALANPDPDVRLYAVRWIADNHLTEFRDEVAALLEGEIPDQRYYLCILGAIHWLDSNRETPPKTVVDGLLARELRNSRRPDDIKALALRLISPTHKQLTLDTLNGYIEGPHAGLRTEAVRTLALGSHAERFQYLAKVAGDETVAPDVRADAVAGLAAGPEHFQPLLERLSASDLEMVAKEAMRVRRLKGELEVPEEFKPEITDLDTWLALTDGRGDEASGRRLFHSTLGPKCATCHTIDGRGGTYGPDLTRYSANHDRRQALTAILHPSRDIAPRYVPWVLETDEGKTLVGLRLPLPGDGGTEPYIDTDGKRIDLKSEQIEFREPSKNSIMPDGLEKTMTVQDVADILAFLLERNENE